VQPGQRFGRAEVIDLNVRVVTPGRPDGYRGARMRCDCGNVFTAMVLNLASGHTTSCGCWRQALKASQPGPGRRAVDAAAAANRTHGLTKHPLFMTWKAMIRRCENPAALAYPRYGGRGIRVCERWHDVATFIADIERWLGPRPAGCTLDRICNDHDYRLDNVRWASWSQQLGNRRPYRKAA
jgi:hypothetical protein